MLVCQSMQALCRGWYQQACLVWSGLQSFSDCVSAVCTSANKMDQQIWQGRVCKTMVFKTKLYTDLLSFLSPGMHIKMLTPACDEAKRLIHWVESGVTDALKKGYLKSLFYGISRNQEGTELLEVCMNLSY